MKRVPAHAGRLSSWERLVFALVFGVMAAFVVVVTVTAAKSGNNSAVKQSADGTRELPGGDDVQSGASDKTAANSESVSQAALDQRLATAIKSAAHSAAGNIAVGVIDETSGKSAVYRGNRHFHTASIVKVDILATLLLQHQKTGTALTSNEAGLATTMIENSDDASASALWSAVGGTEGVQAGDTTLGLTHTRPGRDGYWGLTSTTVLDQLRMLTDLTSASSPLTAASRDYELRLMQNVEADQQWGVPAAASPKTTYAVKNGWLPDPVLWIINSIGVIEYHGQQLLIAVLSNHRASEAGGIAADQAAAIAAAKVIT